MDYKSTLTDLEKYYANTLIVQYNGLPKATATIKLLTKIGYANMLLNQILDAFDWRTARGAQLDVIGEWVGIKRNYTATGVWGNAFLAYVPFDKLVPTPLTDTLQGGYSDYDTFDTLEGGVLTYKDLQSGDQSLGDADYRVVIGLKIIKNNLVHNCKNIDDAIALYFAEKDENGNVIYDEDGYIANPLVYTSWNAHEVVYHYDPSLENIINICYYKNVLPVPTGVSIYLQRIE